MTQNRALILLLAGMLLGGLLWRGLHGNQPVAFAGESSTARPIGTPVTIKPPLGLPPVPIPPDNPPTPETIALGRRLYYDPGLSVDGTVSCATCHEAGLGFTDDKPVSQGVQNRTGTRSAPTVINSAYNQLQFWDGRAPSLEKQAEGPIANPVEMAHTLDGAVKHLQRDAGYRDAFRAAWGTDQITIDMVTKSIASFERTVLSGNSPFDRYYYGGDKKALSLSAQRGLKVFQDPKRGNCAACHAIGKNYALFCDNQFHNIGVGADLQGGFTDAGRYSQTRNDADMGAFKTPTLRNIAQTAPYMHDGSLKTLKDVIDHYIGGGNSNPHLDKEIHVLDFLSGEERADLLEFLNSLTGELPPDVGPPTEAKNVKARAENK
ncbi:MAG TPA: cytochrome c peroxidase [Terriglobales bacterium]|nr:cytochrome c peroxidase [Terriglobales bacterium]